MNKQEAIETIKSNWPTVNYTMLREALEIAINALEGKRITELEGHMSKMLDKLEAMDSDIDPSPIDLELGALMMECHNLDACSCDKISEGGGE